MKWRASGIPTWYADIPKSVLFVIARQMGANLSDSCDDLAAGERAILAEWQGQYAAGNVPQRPIKETR